MKDLIRLGAGSGFCCDALDRGVELMEKGELDVMEQALGGGALRTLRFDETAKSLGHAIVWLPSEGMPGS